MPALSHPRILLARLQAQLRKPPGAARIPRVDVGTLVLYVQRCLRVMPYVRHAPDCRQATAQGKGVGCTCGLAAAWTGQDQDGALHPKTPAATQPPSPVGPW